MIWFISRVLLGIVLIGVACGLAGIYGMLHNQISYTVAPTYFVDLKFPQFGINLDDRNNWGAALVGWRASWWMGGILGIFLVLLGFRIKSHKIFASAFIRSAIWIVLLTLMIGLLALGAAMLWLHVEMIPDWLPTYGSPDPLQFAYAAVMHDSSYLGALISLMLVMATVQRRAVKRDRTNGFRF